MLWVSLALCSKSTALTDKKFREFLYPLPSLQSEISSLISVAMACEHAMACVLE